MPSRLRAPRLVTTSMKVTGVMEAWGRTRERRGASLAPLAARTPRKRRVVAEQAEPVMAARLAAAGWRLRAVLAVMPELQVAVVSHP